MNLLHTGKKHINEIARKPGFESPQYFTWIFRNKTGRSTGSFRKEL